MGSLSEDLRSPIATTSEDEAYEEQYTRLEEGPVIESMIIRDPPMSRTDIVCTIIFCSLFSLFCIGVLAFSIGGMSMAIENKKEWCIEMMEDHLSESMTGKVCEAIRIGTFIGAPLLCLVSFVFLLLSSYQVIKSFAMCCGGMICMGNKSVSVRLMYRVTLGIITALCVVMDILFIVIPIYYLIMRTTEDIGSGSSSSMSI